MKAYVEHVGVTVKDIEWDVKFFRDVLGMEITRTREDDEGNWQMSSRVSWFFSLKV